MKKHEITDLYYLITRQNNTVSAERLNSLEWLSIIREIFKKCGKFLKEAFEKNSQFYRQVKTIKEHIQKGSRSICSEIEKELEYISFSLNLDKQCMFGQKIKIEEMKDGLIFLETWIFITIDGKLLLAELDFCREKKSRNEEATLISAYLHSDNNREHLFSEKFLPLLDCQLAKSIIRHSLDILFFEKSRRETEEKNFKEAVDFWEMVIRRIEFHS